MPENTERPTPFTPVTTTDPEPDDYESNGCTCPPGDDRFVLEIEEGTLILKHAACGKNPPDSWGDCWTDDMYMHPIPVVAKYERDCDGQMWHGMDRCEDGATLTVHPNACSDPVECAHEAAVGQARETSRRLNRRAQALESEIAAYRRAVGLGEVTKDSAEVPLRSLLIRARLAEVPVPDRWELHHERVEAHRLNLSLALGLGTGADWEAIHERSRKLGKTAAASEAYIRLGGPTPPPRGTGYGPSAEELAAHLADQPMSVLQGAFRILGMRLNVSVEENPVQPSPTLAEECCGAEPPEKLTGPEGEDWGTPGDCWCTLPPHGPEVDHLCEPCAERHGMPPWKDAESLPDDAENPWCACGHQRSEHSPALFQTCGACGCMRFYVAVPCVRPDVHPEHLHSGIRDGVTVHGKCPGVRE